MVLTEPAVVNLGGLLIKSQLLKEINFNYEKLRDMENGKQNINPWKIQTLEIT
jgi:hypothetical protein